MGACLGVADSANVSGTRRGAQGGGRLPTLPLRCSQGGLPALSPANPAFSLLFCPYPPSPLPGGKGETLGYFMQGASPLASPELNPGGTGFSFGKRCPRGACPRGCRRALLCRCPRGACLLCRLPTLPFVCFFAPIPPTPFPAGRGSFKVYFAGGFAPGTPATGWEAALAFPLEGGAPRGLRPLHPRAGIANAARVQAGFKTHSRSG